jgi:hypothetical protein
MTMAVDHDGIHAGESQYFSEREAWLLFEAGIATCAYSDDPTNPWHTPTGG